METNDASRWLPDSERPRENGPGRSGNDCVARPKKTERRGRCDAHFSPQFQDYKDAQAGLTPRLLGLTTTTIQRRRTPQQLTPDSNPRITIPCAGGDTMVASKSSTPAVDVQMARRPSGTNVRPAIGGVPDSTIMAVSSRHTVTRLGRHVVKHLESHSSSSKSTPDSPPWRVAMYDIIFEADTAAGRAFDIALLVAILASITVVSLETVPDYKDNVGLNHFFDASEWFLTVLFTIEYVLRLICSRRPVRYAFSFWGIIDLLSILPSYVTFLVGSSQRSFVILRSVRLLRVFRVLKLWRMMNEADELAAAIWRVRDKIIVFLSVVLVAVTIRRNFDVPHRETIRPGMAETDGLDPNSQFTSIPQSMYWAIVTMTTVGYGDVVPQTAVGKVISAMLILLGYSLIIVPSTFVSAEFIQQKQIQRDEVPCQNCDAPTHRGDALGRHSSGRAPRPAGPVSVG